MGKGVGLIGEDEDKVFNKGGNTFWWQEEVEKEKAQ